MLMTYPMAICPCGSLACRINAQEQCQHVGTGEVRFTTRAEREADPDWMILAAQQTVWVGDKTWVTCVGCRKPVTQAQIDKAGADYRATHPEYQEVPFMERPRRETVGAAIGNLAAIARADFT